MGWTSASAVLLTFDEAPPGLSDGEVVTDQYLATHGVTISAINVSRDWDLAAIFDTSVTHSPSHDPDLEAPWAGGNLPRDMVLNNALMISEADDADGDGFVDRIDDEGRRPAGSLIFDFEGQVSSFGFDVIDVESVSANQADAELAFYMGATEVVIEFATLLGRLDPTYGAVTWGNYDNSANRIAPFTASEVGLSYFDRVDIRLGGSAAVDNINWSVPDGGATALLLGMGLFGLSSLRKRLS
jgi:hypothetical protein